MINEKQNKAIELLLEGKLSKVDIANTVERSRQWLYDAVINDDECKAEMDRRLHELKTDGMNRIKSNINKCINNIITLANNSSSEKIRLDANEYLINRVMGGITTKVEDITDKDEDNNDKITKETLDSEFKKFKIIKKAE